MKESVVKLNEEVEEFIAHSLNPAKVRDVEIVGDREARVLVAEDQLSLAIGRGGQNVRLAAKLTGWKIDVRSQTRPDEALEGGVADAENISDDIDDDSSDTVEKKEESKEEEKPIYQKPDEDDEDNETGEVEGDKTEDKKEDTEEEVKEDEVEEGIKEDK